MIDLSEALELATLALLVILAWGTFSRRAGRTDVNVPAMMKKVDSIEERLRLCELEMVRLKTLANHDDA